MRAAVSSITIKDVIGDLQNIVVRKLPKESTLIYFTLEIPRWIVENEEIDLAGITLCEFRKRLDLYRRHVPRRGKRPVRLYIYGSIRLTVDAVSAYCFDRNIIAITLAMDGYFSNAKWQMANNCMKPYDE